MSRALPLMLALVACGPPDNLPVDEFGYWMADVLCERTQECSRASFDASWYSVADCRAQIERDYAALAESMDDLGCDYEGRKAATAWEDIARMSCEDFYEGDAVESIGEIWDECVPFTFTDTTYYYF